MTIPSLPIGTPVWVTWPAGVIGPERPRQAGVVKEYTVSGKAVVTPPKSAGTWVVAPERLERRAA